MTELKVDFLVDRSNFMRTTTRSTILEYDRNKAVVSVEQFALTANNITYALMGKTMNYWDFFPADAGWGQIPVWGFGRVLWPGASGLVVDERLFGYFPMATHVVMEPGKIDPLGLYDLNGHRRHLSPVYNYYARTSSHPAFDAAWKYEDMLLRPIFYASFLVHDFLSDGASIGADSVIITSASSKAAIGLGHMLSTTDQPHRDIIGVTSEANLAFVRGLGIFDQVYTYDELDKLACGRAVIADFSGNAAMVTRLFTQLGDRAALCCLVGYTHWNEHATEVTDGRQSVRFFVPSRMRTRVHEWGLAEFNRRYEEAFRSYRTFSRNWLEVIEGSGPDAVAEAFGLVAQNRVRPERGHILSLRGGSVV